MSNGFIRVPQESLPDKLIDASEITVDTNVVERQRIVIADTTTDGALTKVTNSDPTLSDYGVVTRNIPFGTQEVEFTLPSNSSVTSVAASLSSVTLLSSNPNRKSASFFNDSTATLYLKLGSTASSTSFTIKMEPSSFYELSIPCYSGVIDGIWDAINGAVRVTEIY